MSTYFIQQEAKYDTTPGAPTATPAQLMELLNRTSEHFGCFVIYAYDFNGNPLKLGVQTSQMEDCALQALVKGDALGEIQLFEQALIQEEEDPDFEEFEDEWDDDEDDFFDDPED